MFRIVLFLLMSYLTIYASSKCSDIKDLAQHNGHYYGISSSMMTFDEAKRFAENKGGYLAIPNNAAENIFLKGMIGGNRGAWIGVHDPNYNTNYSYSVGQKKNPARFVDIKGKALSYSNWESSQPDNLIKENEGDYDEIGSKVAEFKKINPTDGYCAAIMLNDLDLIKYFLSKGR